MCLKGEAYFITLRLLREPCRDATSQIGVTF